MLKKLEPQTFSFSVEEHKKLGITTTQVADLLAQYGAAIVSVVIDGLRGGLTLAFLKEVLTTFGPIFFQQAVAGYLMERKAKLKAAEVETSKG